MMLLIKSLFYNSSIEKTYRIFWIYRNLQLLFSFIKRVRESHVLLHNLLVQLFSGKHKMAFDGDWGVTIDIFR